MKLQIPNVCVLINRIFPITLWIKQYNLQIALADFIAGITLGLTLIPQSIAYASLAGLGPEYGLYSSLIGGITYMFFGTIPELNIAPTALLSLLTFTYTHNLTNSVAAATFLCFLSGIIELFCGILHLGFLVDFVSTPVVAAFTSAGALVIASSQVKNLLGLKFEAENFLQVWIKVFEHIKEISKWDTVLGVSCCIILLSMRKLKDFGSAPILEKSITDDVEKPKAYKTVIWLISICRNAFVVILSALMAYEFGLHDLKPFNLTSKVPSGLPKPKLPLSANSTDIEMLKDLNSGIIIVPFIAILANVGIAKAFANGKVVAASQEMIAVGMCNIFGSFFSSYPVNASFSRSAVGNASGVKTPLAGLYTGCLILLALTFLTPYFSYIPKATLAAVIICAVIFMVEVTLPKLIWNINKRELVSFFITFIACLFLDIAYGILIGIIVDILLLLYTTARPRVDVETVMVNGIKYIKVTPTSAILFPSAEFVREEIMKNLSKLESYTFIVVDCTKINKIDFTAAKCLNAFEKDFKKNGKRVVFYAPQKPVKEIIEKSCDGATIMNKQRDLNNSLKDYRDTKLTTILTMDNNERSTNL